MLTLTLVASLLILDATLVEGRVLTTINARDAALIASLADGCELIYSPSFDLIGPAAAEAGIWTLHGVDPFQLRWSAEAIARAAGVEQVGYSVTAPPLPPDTEDASLALAEVEPDYDALAQLGVQHVAARFPLQSNRLALEAEAGGIHLYRLVGSENTVVCSQGPNRFVIDTSGEPPDSAGRVAIRQAWAAGWFARVDGDLIPVDLTQDMWLTVTLPTPTAQQVEFVYRPLPDFAGLGISGATVVGLITWRLTARRQRGARHEG